MSDLEAGGDCEIRALQVEYLPGWAIELNGNPRGCVLTLKTPYGREIGVP